MVAPIKLEEIKLIKEADFASAFPVKNAKSFFEYFNKSGSQSIATLTNWCNRIGVTDKTMRAYLIDCMQKQVPASFEGYNAYAKTAIANNEKLTISAKAGKFAISALATAGNMLAMWAISEVISVISACVTASSRLQESAKELSTQFSSTQSDIDGYKTKIADLYTVINDGSSSYEETYNARQQLLSIQNEMIEKFGSEAEAVQLVTDAVNGQTDALDSLTQLQWNETVDKFNYDPDRKWTEKFGDAWANFWSGSSDNYERMQKEMENTDVSFDIVPKIYDKNYKQYDKFAEILRKDFGAEITSNVANGRVYNTFTLSGNLTDIYTQMQNIRDLAKDMGLDDSYINAISEQTAKTKSTLDGYQEFFNQGILQDKIINKNI